MTKQQQYNEYLNAGGIMTIEEWTQDGRYCQWMEGPEGLIDAVLDWWEENKKIVDWVDGMDFDRYDKNEPPKFVAIAMALKAQTKSE